jgi:hypothetical protein
MTPPHLEVTLRLVRSNGVFWTSLAPSRKKLEFSMRTPVHARSNSIGLRILDSYFDKMYVTNHHNCVARLSHAPAPRLRNSCGPAPRAVWVAARPAFGASLGRAAAAGQVNLSAARRGPHLSAASCHFFRGGRCEGGRRPASPARCRDRRGHPAPGHA